MRKKVIVVIIALFFLTQISSALIVETPLVQEEGGVYEYTDVFNDKSGLLTVTTIGFFNASGVSVAKMLVSAFCFENTTFRLKVWDSEITGFVDPNSELGVYSKSRYFTVMPNPDTKGLISCAISVTNELGDITFASIFIEYYYDEAIPEYNPGGEDDDVITRKEHREALQKLYWAIAQIILGAIGGGILIWLIARKKYQRNDD
jgi:hypothetical protein